MRGSSNNRALTRKKFSLAFQKPVGYICSFMGSGSLWVVVPHGVSAVFNKKEISY